MSTEMNSKGCLVLKIQPERVYDFMNLKKVQAYFPGTLNILLSKYRLRVILGGREVFYTTLTGGEMKLLGAVEPIVM